MRAAPAEAATRVCPGRYVERVVVDMALTPVGTPDEVAAVGCLSPTGPTAADLDRHHHCAVDAPDGALCEDD